MNFAGSLTNGSVVPVRRAAISSRLVAAFGLAVFWSASSVVRADTLPLERLFTAPDLSV
jgi:hypothetical protein